MKFDIFVDSLETMKKTEIRDLREGHCIAVDDCGERHLVGVYWTELEEHWAKVVAIPSKCVELGRKVVAYYQ